MPDKVAFLGLGVMGYPMAGWLAKAGHDVTVFNRTTERADRWVSQYAGQRALTPAAAVEGAAAVFVCVGNDRHVRDVLLAEGGVFDGLKPGALLVDHTTASADLARELFRCAAQLGVEFVDAPVSGGQQGAERGQLTVMCGGTVAGFDRAKVYFDHYARKASLLGPTGSGQLTKMVNQVCIAGLLQGLSEGLHFAEVAGLDPAAVVDVIAQGAAQSWQMDHRHATMIADEFEHGFAVDWMRKDLRLALEEACRNGAQLPVTALVDQFYADVQGLGGGRWDTSSLIKRLRAMSSLVR